MSDKLIADIVIIIDGVKNEVSDVINFLKNFPKLYPHIYDRFCETYKCTKNDINSNLAAFIWHMLGMPIFDENLSSCFDTLTKNDYENAKEELNNYINNISLERYIVIKTLGPYMDPITKARLLCASKDDGSAINITSEEMDIGQLFSEIKKQRRSSTSQRTSSYVTYRNARCHIITGSYLDVLSTGSYLDLGTIQPNTGLLQIGVVMNDCSDGYKYATFSFVGAGIVSRFSVNDLELLKISKTVCSAALLDTNTESNKKIWKQWITSYELLENDKQKDELQIDPDWIDIYFRRIMMVHYGCAYPNVQLTTSTSTSTSDEIINVEHPVFSLNITRKDGTISKLQFKSKEIIEKSFEIHYTRGSKTRVEKINNQTKIQFLFNMLSDILRGLINQGIAYTDAEFVCQMIHKNLGIKQGGSIRPIYRKLLINKQLVHYLQK